MKEFKLRSETLQSFWMLSLQVRLRRSRLYWAVTHHHRGQCENYCIKKQQRSQNHTVEHGVLKCVLPRETHLIWGKMLVCTCARSQLIKRNHHSACSTLKRSFPTNHVIYWAAACHYSLLDVWASQQIGDDEQSCAALTLGEVFV